MGILNNHIPVLTGLDTGVLYVRTQFEVTFLSPKIILFKSFNPAICNSFTLESYTTIKE